MPMTTSKITKPTAEELAEIGERIRELVGQREGSGPHTAYAAYHANEARRLRAKASAARDRIAALLRTARAHLDDGRWIEMLARLGVTEAEADARMQHVEGAAGSDPAPPPAAGPAPAPAISRVYFLQALDGGPIKIGVSNNPEGRLASLQTGSPVKLRILGTAAGDQRREARLHRKLAAHRLHGEWFADAPEVMAAIGEALS